MNQPRKYQPVTDVMDPNIVFIDAMASIKEAVEVMRREEVEALFVNKRHDHDVYSIVAPKDFIKGVVLTDRSAMEVNIYEIMSKPAISVPHDMDVQYVARLLIKCGLRLAPVEKDGKFVGVVSLSNIVLNNVLFNQ